MAFVSILHRFWRAIRAGMLLANPPVLWDIESDPVLAGTKLIAEAWDAAGLYQVGSFVGDSWREWNGRFRDDVRSFFRGDEGTVRILPTACWAAREIYRIQATRSGTECEFRHLSRWIHAQRSGLLQSQAQRGERRRQSRRRETTIEAGTAESRAPRMTRQSRASETVR